MIDNAFSITAVMGYSLAYILGLAVSNAEPVKVLVCFNCAVLLWVNLLELRRKL